jgi:hypothetical protein
MVVTEGLEGSRSRLSTASSAVAVGQTVALAGGFTLRTAARREGESMVLIAVTGRGGTS